MNFMQGFRVHESWIGVFYPAFYRFELMLVTDVYSLKEIIPDQERGVVGIRV